jgi:hypothetical protein
MTAQATAMPRQQPQRLTPFSGDRRLRRRPLATAAIALAAPVFAVTTLAALGAVTDSGGAGLGSLPGADGLKGASGKAVAHQPPDADKWDRSKDFEKNRGGNVARKQTQSAPPDAGGRQSVPKLPREPAVPVGLGGGRSPTVTDVPTDPTQPGYPGGDTGGSDDSVSSGGSGSDSGSTGTGSGGEYGG